jgi:hypothetical protein
MREGRAVRSVGWLILLLLVVTNAAHAAPDASERPMPDPCIEAPNLPFCE